MFVVFAEIIGLVTDMHACAGNIINYFSTKASPGEPGSAESLGSNPARLCFVVKQAVRESSVGKSLSKSFIAGSSREGLEHDVIKNGELQ